MRVKARVGAAANTWRWDCGPGVHPPQPGGPTVFILVDPPAKINRRLKNGKFLRDLAWVLLRQE